MHSTRENLSNYLVSDFSLSVRDPVWKDIFFTPEIFAVTKNKQFQKLSGIRQLGPVSLVYPGAVHTRLSHSIGVYNISRKILLTLLRTENIELTKEGINSFLCASLLHDIGHFPFAHSLKDVVERTHESLATDIILGDKALYNSIKEAGADADAVCSIIDSENCRSADKEIVLYRNMLSGTLDPDKLDYLCRDAYFCGVPYGVQDVSWITEHIRLYYNRLAVSISDAGSVEHLLFSKYLMYRNVYWHEKTRCATAMVKEAVVSALKDRVIEEKDLYYLDDYDFISLCKSKNYKPFSLVADSNSGILYSLKEQFSYTKPISNEEKETLRCRYLEELGPKADRWNVLIDIPEPISFESSIPVLMQDGSVKNFSEADELFSGIQVCQAFSKALRKVRIFAKSEDVQ